MSTLEPGSRTHRRILTSVGGMSMGRGDLGADMKPRKNECVQSQIESSDYTTIAQNPGAESGAMPLRVGPARKHHCALQHPQCHVASYAGPASGPAGPLGRRTGHASCSVGHEGLRHSNGQAVPGPEGALRTGDRSHESDGSDTLLRVVPARNCCLTSDACGRTSRERRVRRAESSKAKEDGGLRRSPFLVKPLKEEGRERHNP